MYAFVDYRISDEEISNLLKLNIEVIKIPKCNRVYDAINGHPDIQMNIIKNNTDNKLIIHKDISTEFRNILDEKGIKYIVSKKSLDYSYPSDIILNALILENYFIHTLSYTDENLFNSQKAKININVSQGYTKCSVLPINKKALITSDKGIFKALKEYDFDILLLPPGDILLPSLDYGFIGGTGGMITDDKIVFFGDLNYYKYGDAVIEFLSKYRITPIYLKKGKLIDRGSIFVL
ncbi:MAG: DUF6873 family GME fold protein [Clostridium sp.]